MRLLIYGYGKGWTRQTPDQFQKLRIEIRPKGAIFKRGEDAIPVDNFPAMKHHIGCIEYAAFQCCETRGKCQM